MTPNHPATRPLRARRADRDHTRNLILDAAMQLASVEGIEGLTIGRLAATLGMSKSGLYAHFGSKEQLQLATIEAALVVVRREVLDRAAAAPEGLARLEALSEAYFSYLERWVFEGGCFFASLSADADARPGAVRDLAAAVERAWLAQLAAQARAAARNGETSNDTDSNQIAFELHACFALTNFHNVLFRDAAVLERGRRAVRGILERARRPRR